MKKIEVLVGWSENNYSATCSINGMVIATGKTLDALKKDLEAALDAHIKFSIEEGDKLPAYIVNKRFKLNYVLQMSALLHQLDGTVTRTAIARVTGINVQQLSHYMTGHRSPREIQRKKIIAGIHKIGDELRQVV